MLGGRKLVVSIHGGTITDLVAFFFIIISKLYSAAGCTQAACKRKADSIGSAEKGSSLASTAP
jgi:hypothetical protein